MDFKRGSSFDFSGEITITERITPIADPTPISDLTGWTGESWIREESGKLIQKLTFVWLDATQRLARIYSPVSTASWPICEAEFDIKFTSPDSEVVVTQTTPISIKRSITGA
jgi:hypothetical protein